MTPSLSLPLNAPTDARGHRRNYGLDLFRAIAISQVLISHFFHGGVIVGRLGVELFFVLSGFLIGGIFWKQLKTVPNFGWSDLKLFLHRRWMRTLPNYYLFLVVHLLLAPIMWKTATVAEAWQRLPIERVAPYLVFMQNFAWSVSPFYPVSWSLAIEEWFYLVFPFAVLLLFRLTKSRKTAFICVTVTLMILPFLARLFADPSLNLDAGIRTVVIYRLDSLMFGVALALIKSERAQLWPRLRLAFWPGIAAYFALMLVMRQMPKTGHHLVVAVLMSLVPLACVSLIPWFESLPRPTEWLACWVENISQWSYSIYLSHMPILFVFYYLTASLPLGFVGKLAVKIVALVCALVVSSLVYRYFELPIMARRRRA